MLGRTGNNLFQYALGRVLAEKHGVPLVMDASWFNSEGWRSVSCIRRMGIQAEISRGWSLGSRILRKLDGRHPWELQRVPILKENNGYTGFDKQFLDAPDDVVLMGYFQSPRYFGSIEHCLRQELNLAELDWSAATVAQAAMLSDSESVAVHVRRTDFVGTAEFDICDATYYRRAMADMKVRLSNPQFHIFSDDPEWCGEHLAGGDVEVASVPYTSSDPLHDLYLMSCCRHHVIANSSFSWWAAWLGKGPEQQVLVPPSWFGGGIDTPITDKLCDGWRIGPNLVPR